MNAIIIAQDEQMSGMNFLLIIIVMELIIYNCWINKKNNRVNREELFKDGI